MRRAMPPSLLRSQMDALLLQNVFLGQLMKCRREEPLNHNTPLALMTGTALQKSLCVNGLTESI